jgi:hypothetical protein
VINRIINGSIDRSLARPENSTVADNDVVRGCDDSWAADRDDDGESVRAGSGRGI